MKFLLILPFICLAGGVNAQDEVDTLDITIRRRLTPEKYTSIERLAKHPFNKAASVKLAAFGVKSKTGRVREDAQPRIPIANGKVALNKLDEIVDLTKNQIDTLTDILFNTCYKWTINTRQTSFCYTPRNAILFFDSENNNYAFIEICFGCNKMKIGYTHVPFEDEPCNDTYRELKEFFTKLGLSTDDRIIQK
jgi:hypothetical protein